jgi:hydroxylamine dehydrogenase
MAQTEVGGRLRTARMLIAGLVAVIVVLGLTLIAWAVIRSMTSAAAAEARPNALASSTDVCVDCHRQATPGIIQQFGVSTMAAAKVTCRDCHEVTSDHPGAVEHEGSYVLGSPSAGMCQRCHKLEVLEYNASRHSLPAYTAVVGIEPLTEAQRALYQAIPEGSFAPDKTRHALYAIEGQDITRFACETCHDIGKPAADGSVGECQKCHLRHEFSLEQARMPETCNACHIGPDHPQWEIYQESPHGIAYATGGDTWNWGAEPGTLTVVDFPAPTCAICHMSGFGTTGTTHDVGNRLTWYLFSPLSQRRPSWQENLARMQGVCRECHNEDFLTEFYTAADTATEAVNARVRASDAVMEPLKQQGLLTAEPFDEPIDFLYFDLWHYWGRTAKFGLWMQGPDYTQWHGIYELLKDQSELEVMAAAKLEAAGAGDVP